MAGDEELHATLRRDEGHFVISCCRTVLVAGHRLITILLDCNSKPGYDRDMPLDMKAFANAGARSRLAELQAEMDAIRRAFPGLDGRANGRTPRTARRRVSSQATTDTAGAAPARGRKPMSAAAKKAVSGRMKKYWAGRRKAKAAKSA